MYAVPVCIAATPSAHFQLPISRLIVANAEMHGIYSRENVIKAYAERGVKTPDMVEVRAAVPLAEYRTLIVDTTASFATSPERRDTAGCQCPKPRGLNIGAIKEPIAANMLSELLLVIWRDKSKFWSSHITTLIEKITVPAFTIKPLVFSHVFLSTDSGIGIL